MLLSALLFSPISAMPTATTAPQVIAHRGASGERPEHTRAAYERAIEQGADIIEPDLVMTQDGHLIVRHENEIGSTTDVASHPEFSDRHTTKTIDGLVTTGWFTEDFTLSELKGLRTRERLPDLRPGNTAYDGQDTILTFEEVLQIASEATVRTGRTIGIAPELKHPSYFASLGLLMEDTFVSQIEAHDRTGPNAAVLIQCFEVGPLERLSKRIQTPLLQLMSVKGGPVDRPDLTYAQMATPDGLIAIARYAGAIGVETAMILPRDEMEASLPPTPLVSAAHQAGLEVVVWTLRAENQFLPLEHRSSQAPASHGDLRAYAQRFYDLGADALFTDFPGILRP